MHLFWFLSLVGVALGAPFPSTLCPSDCECLTMDMVTTTRCTSLGFIHDAPADQLNKVSHLDVRHSNLTKIGSVRKLHGLKSLNMAHNDMRHLSDLTSLTKLSMLNLRGNKLKTIEEHLLPKNLEHLDVSANHLAALPSLEQLKRLKEVNLAGNPFMCTCEMKAKCEDLQKLVAFLKPVTCRDGSGHVRVISELSCSEMNPDHLGHNDLEKMQNDEALEGSGEEPEESEDDHTDIFAEDNVRDSKKLEEIQNEELLPSPTTKLPELTEEDYEDNGEDEQEGSGHSGDIPENDYEDEGSGDEVLIYPTTEAPLLACNFNCTPLTLDDPESTNSTEPDPSLIDEVGKVFKDIFSDGEEEENEESSEEVTEAPMVNVEVRKTESGRVGDNTPIVINEEEKVHAVEDTEASEVKEAGSPLGISNNMIVVIALIVIMVCIIIYTILVKRRKNRRRPQHTNGSSAPGQEMKVMKPTKPARQSLQPSDKKVPEKVPLMNGQNDSAPPKNGQTVPDSTTPLINEPEMEKEEQPVQLRSPRGDHSPLLPETHRVTVQAKELNAPKTPLLVTRVRSQDGQIVTTPEADQRH